MQSVIQRPGILCSACSLPGRWCICPAHCAIETDLQISLLTHQREHMRASSTGNLVHRVIKNTTRHIWYTANPPSAAQVIQPGKEVWLLHPNGHALPEHADPASIQVVLLDGSWTETGLIARTAGSWGRLVSLPMQGASRYWLREKQAGGRFSTIEALLFLMSSLGLAAQCTGLRIQFELHVYAHLRARGRTLLAAEFLEQSMIQSAMPDFLQAMQAPRPL